ncbi:hypothetical protein L202_02610 [Cryptococcus amylolentus CBS 6039]|uniref:Uncharacterized protein n=1 Tax=Cryptococcus amylolentus CBS 6039 TaxID=1295533 RepID=A0A1E3HVL4_9TREE|nr:hypothetical protein L202_02610 [Cryptococcus amylolentus CBS 6039]ODN80350.1 hypothetical protein L202_02610 [Cryptococcus amylolentus CBS 6039]
MAQLPVDEIPPGDPIYAWAPVGDTINSSPSSDAGSNHENPPNVSVTANADGLYESSVPASRTVLSPNTWYDIFPFDPSGIPRDIAQETLRPSPHGGEEEEEEEEEVGAQLVDILMSFRTESSDIQGNFRIQVSKERTRREEYYPWLDHVVEHGAVQHSTGGAEGAEGSAEGGGRREAGDGAVVPAGRLGEVVETVFGGASEEEMQDAWDKAMEVFSKVHYKFHEE